MRVDGWKWMMGWMVICIHIGPRPYARLLAPYRGDMVCVHPNRRASALRMMGYHHSSPL